MFEMKPFKSIRFMTYFKYYSLMCLINVVTKQSSAADCSKAAAADVC